MKKWIILISILLVLLGGVLYISTFELKDIRVSGCKNVDEQQVIDAVEAKGNNTLFLYITNKIKPIEGIPFVAKIEIEYLSKNEIAVVVYEKSMAGCVEYMNGYVYFDKDGIVLDASSKMIEGVPCIKGLEFDSWEIGEKLPIGDKGKFQHILSLTQLIEKYELDIDAIKFTAENEIVLVHKDITIELGNGDYLEIQLMNLGSILSGLEGLKGTLYMKDFNSDKATASFKQ